MSGQDLLGGGQLGFKLADLGGESTVDLLQLGQLAGIELPVLVEFLQLGLGFLDVDGHVGLLVVETAHGPSVGLL